MPHKSSPALKKAVHYLLNEFTERHWVDNARLLTVREMAVAADVSLQTMTKAVAFCRGEGLIVHYKRRLCIAPGAKRAYDRSGGLLDESVPDPKLPTTPPLRVRQQLLHDIYNRRLHPGHPLPSYKELTAWYNCSCTTLKKAISLLFNEGILSPYYKKFMVTPFGSSKAGSSICMLIPCDIRGNFYLEALNEQFLRQFSAECSNSRIRCETTGICFDDGRFTLFDQLRQPCDFIDNDAVLGYVYCALINKEIQRHSEMFAFLSSIRKPVALYDVVGDWEIPRSMKKPNVRYFTAAVSQKAGKETGHFLLDRGHRSIAWLSPFHQSIWSQNRLSGLCSVYETAGITAGVKAFTMDKPPMIYSYFDEAHRRFDYHALRKYYHTIAENLDQEYKAVLDPLFDYELPEFIVPKAEFRRSLRSLFDQALCDKSITAWVAANDEVACAALGYCREKEVSVPAKISIAGFDDTDEALRNGLTSYNFNTSALVLVLLDFILQRNLYAPLYCHARSGEVDGMVVGRNTTGCPDT
ncbi:MAG: GntR family transcriptional regulator [Chitinivibrionales bacterium]|nr:GntR family transcriptional regulator [Chitinivibrionales bacterium]